MSPDPHTVEGLRRTSSDLTLSAIWRCSPPRFTQLFDQPDSGEIVAVYLTFAFCNLVDFRSISVTMNILPVHYCTLLCTFFKNNLHFLSIHPEIHYQYITHDVLGSESESHKNKDSASPILLLLLLRRKSEGLVYENAENQYPRRTIGQK